MTNIANIHFKSKIRNCLKCNKIKYISNFGRFTVLSEKMRLRNITDRNMERDQLALDMEREKKCLMKLHSKDCYLVSSKFTTNIHISGGVIKHCFTIYNKVNNLQFYAMIDLLNTECNII